MPLSGDALRPSGESSSARLPRSSARKAGDGRGQLCPVHDPRLGKHRLQLLLDRQRALAEPPTDLDVREARRDEPGDVNARAFDQHLNAAAES